MRNANTVIDYRARAEMHRPDAAGLAASIRELAGNGLKAYDIAVTLRIGMGAVEQALRGKA
jgi:hypothetical protein